MVAEVIMLLKTMSQLMLAVVHAAEEVRDLDCSDADKSSAAFGRLDVAVDALREARDEQPKWRKGEGK